MANSLAAGSRKFIAKQTLMVLGWTPHISRKTRITSVVCVDGFHGCHWTHCGKGPHTSVVCVDGCHCTRYGRGPHNITDYTLNVCLT